MNENRFGSRVRQILNQGTLDGSILKRLRVARERALASQRAGPAPALRWANNVLGRFEGWGDLSLRVLLPAALLIAALATIYTWQQNQRLAEIEEIDALLLTDDLPIDAYLDRGFHNWLKRRSAEQ